MTLKSANNCGVDVFGFIHLDMGMGQATRASAMALLEAGVDIAIHPRYHDDHSASDQRLKPYVRAEQIFPVNLFYFNAVDTPQLPVIFGENVYEKKYNIGVWNWELEGFPNEWISSIDLMDEIWAPSTFIRQSVISAGTEKPITLMPYPIIDSNDQYLKRDTFALDDDVFHFLFACDLNSYIDRKNPAAAILAFRKAFSADRKDVRLVIKVHGKRAFVEARLRLWEAIGTDNRIILIDANIGRHAMESLHASCDAFISLHRSEGYGLNMAESMWLGKPVIATRYSGNLDFMNDDNSCLVDCTMIPIMKDQYLLGDGQQWAAPDVDQAANYMRKLVDDRPFAQDLGKRASASVRQNLSTATVGQKMRARLEQIFAGLQNS